MKSEEVEWELLVIAQNDPKARRKLREILYRRAANENSIFYTKELAFLLYEDDRIEEAKQYYRKALNLKQDDSEVLFNLGLLSVGEDAEQYYLRAFEIDPNMLDALDNLGVLFMNSAKYEEAEMLYLRALKIEPDRISTAINLGILHTRKKLKEKAEKYYLRVLEINPDEVSVLNNLGLLRYEQKRYEEAEQYYTRALKANNDDLLILNNFRMLLEAQGRYTEALQLLAKAYNLDPEYEVTLYDMADILYEHEGITEDTITYFAQAAHQGHMLALEMLEDLAQEGNEIAAAKLSEMEPQSDASDNESLKSNEANSDADINNEANQVHAEHTANANDQKDSADTTLISSLKSTEKVLRGIENVYKDDNDDNCNVKTHYEEWFESIPEEIRIGNGYVAEQLQEFRAECSMCVARKLEESILKNTQELTLFTELEKQRSLEHTATSKETDMFKDYIAPHPDNETSIENVNAYIEKTLCSCDGTGSDNRVPIMTFYGSGIMGAAANVEHELCSCDI